MASTARFASLTEKQIEQIEKDKDSANTKKVIAKSVKVLRSYLAEKNLSTDFESLSNAELDQVLKGFYANARTEKGDLYKCSSFKQVRYGISKHMKDNDVDIYTPDFNNSNNAFKAVMVNLTRSGKGGVDHTPAIASGDIFKMYAHPCAFCVDTPVGLQNKVMFELMYYTCRRGRENIHGMTQTTYVIEKDDEEREYVTQCTSELDKNHRDDMDPDDCIGEGRMYERPGSSRCPVTSYKRYLSKLNPEYDPLWQRPLDSFCEESSVWYYNQRIGANTLSKFMGGLSKMTSLSKHYTNHSIRATSMTVMDEAGIEARHIMRVSGHRYENAVFFHFHVKCNINPMGIKVFPQVGWEVPHSPHVGHPPISLIMPQLSSHE
jgi:hypothetical protein